MTSEDCDVNWGSHGCRFTRGHSGPHECGEGDEPCCECADHDRDYEDEGCVSRPPYYGPDTRFYGDDAAALGLPLVVPL